MEIQNNISKITSPQKKVSGEIINATMDDVYHVLIAIQKAGVPSEHDLELWRLSEQYLHNHTVSGEFEYDTHYWGTWTIEKIKQYKPEPQKSPEHFVVEM